MMQTIISENFVQWIILRHTSGIAAPGSADILFMRGLETGESPLAGSIRNIRVLNQAITENTTINLSLHLNFLHTLINCVPYLYPDKIAISSTERLVFNSCHAA